ncbi:MAG: alpha-L-glutamate ligase-like protein [bacterium]|nr:alpha-L-glutamate ligase-like protein [bacterium]
MLEVVKKLASLGIMGINKRNADYISVYNPRKLFPLVDDKLKTKILAENAGLEVPKLYGVIEIQRQIRDLASILAPLTDFAIKPACGSGGDGILVVSGRVKDLFRTVNGQLLSLDEISQHLTRLLSGVYSLGGRPDKIIIEYRVQFDPVFERISYLGVPDVRIIVFQGVPIMSMIRLPTRMSHGKANLHKGAIGVGICMASGTTLKAVWKNSVVEEHPDTGNTVEGVNVPDWQKLLEIASRCYQLTGLGYVGVDLVIDKDKGPLLLELNARPGLNIQIANRAGLISRLKLVEENINLLNTIEDKVRFAREKFSS